MTDHYIHTENGPVELSAVPAGYWTSHWIFEPVANTNFVRIRHRFREDQYLQFENGPLESSSVPAGYWTSHWEIIREPTVAATASYTAVQDSLALVALYNATDGPNWRIGSPVPLLHGVALRSVMGALRGCVWTTTSSPGRSLLNWAN